jgi:DNA transformation protein
VTADSFTTYVVDQLAGLGPVRMKRMFGGAGLYLGELMFAIIDEARLYFRTTPASASAYESRGAKPFEPWAGHVMKGYWEVPAEVLDDADQAVDWAKRAVADARMLKKPTRKPARART